MIDEEKASGGKAYEAEVSKAGKAVHCEIEVSAANRSRKSRSAQTAKSSSKAWLAGGPGATGTAVRPIMRLGGRRADT